MGRQAHYTASHINTKRLQDHFFQPLPSSIYIDRNWHHSLVEVHHAFPLHFLHVIKVIEHWTVGRSKAISSLIPRRTGAFSQNVGKLFSKLKLVTDNLLFIYAGSNWEATERGNIPCLPPSFFACDKGIKHWTLGRSKANSSLVPRLTCMGAWERGYTNSTILRYLHTQC